MAFRRHARSQGTRRPCPQLGVVSGHPAMSGGNLWLSRWRGGATGAQRPEMLLGTRISQAAPQQRAPWAPMPPVPLLRSSEKQLQHLGNPSCLDSTAPTTAETPDTRLCPLPAPRRLHLVPGRQPHSRRPGREVCGPPRLRPRSHRHGSIQLPFPSPGRLLSFAFSKGIFLCGPHVPAHEQR